MYNPCNKVWHCLIFSKIGFMFILGLTATSLANDIYVTQSGNTLDLDITQDGTDNEFGDSGGDAILTGDDMTFAITQTGDTNKIDATIKGNDYTGTWTITGFNNSR